MILKTGDKNKRMSIIKIRKFLESSPCASVVQPVIRGGGEFQENLKRFGKLGSP
jgi:hypothetical protein